MTSQLEVLPGAHLVANRGGVIVVVAHHLDAPATVESPAGEALTALLGLVDQAARTEQRRTGRVFARLATNWLMSLEDEDSVEFGVLTPNESGLAVFLHGGVTAVLAHADQSEVLHGRDAGFTVDRVVTPVPAIGVGVFVDEGGESRESLPARGIYELGAGTVPGRGVVLWSGAQGVAESDRPMLWKRGRPMAQSKRQHIALEPGEVAPLQVESVAGSAAVPGVGAVAGSGAEPIARPDPVFEEDSRRHWCPPRRWWPALSRTRRVRSGPVLS
ncbi:hypothetical protein ACLMAL_32190 [Nocardia sp. CWNU-33]|uniref:hypothetical protein n=1 Tax=Nocardia sp. CWNU-33 TaxID=3392117 RepID=UPI00398E7E4A